MTEHEELGLVTAEDAEKAGRAFAAISEERERVAAQYAELLETIKAEAAAADDKYAQRIAVKTTTVRRFLDANKGAKLLSVNTTLRQGSKSILVETETTALSTLPSSAVATSQRVSKGQVKALIAAGELFVTADGDIVTPDGEQTGLREQIGEPSFTMKPTAIGAEMAKLGPVDDGE